jgi:hypothetical protein
LRLAYGSTKRFAAKARLQAAIDHINLQFGRDTVRTVRTVRQGCRRQAPSPRRRARPLLHHALNACLSLAAF